jgi:hypothetical protein
MTTFRGIEWPVVYTGSGCSSLMESEADQERFEQMAAEFLWNWTERVYGTNAVIYRPCQSNCGAERPATFWGNGPYPQYDEVAGWNPVIINGEWFNVSCGTCYQNTCGCDKASSIRLPGPVMSVTQIKVDGVVLVAGTDYRVDGSTIWRLQDKLWPTCQEFSKPTTEVGTWQITYQRGSTVPVGGQTAAGTLACEMAKAANNDGSCRLPQRIQSITRPGVTMAVLDPFDGLERGATGIWSVDSWVNSVTKPIRSSAVYSVDAKPSRGSGQFKVGPR